MIRIEHSAIAEVPADRAFEYMSDHRNVPKWMFGVSQFDPIGELDHGLDARFDVAMTIGPKVLESVVRISEWVEGEVITLESESGIVNASTWRFESLDEERTRLDVTFSYRFPRGLAGKALERIVEPFVGEAIRRTEASVRRQLEAGPNRVERSNGDEG